MAVFHSISPSRRTAVSRAVYAQFPLQKNSMIPVPIRVPAYLFLLAVVVAQHACSVQAGEIFSGGFYA